MNELTKRLLTAGALGTLTLYLIFESPLGFTALLVLAVLFGLYEFLKLNNIAVLYKIICASLVLGYGAIVVVGLPTHHPFATLIFPIATLWWLNNFWTVSRYPAVKPDNFFILFNAPLLLLPLFGLIELQLTNLNLLLLLLAIVWGADSFAYFSGKIFGKHKLAPNLSGGKTIEGSIGGVFGALILTIIWMFVTNNFAWQFIPIALITAVFSVVGDLYESIYKRETGVKDSGNILPGHGGILDRLDGIFAATPVFIVMVFFADLL